MIDSSSYLWYLIKNNRAMAHGIWGAVPSFYYEAMPEKKLLKMTNIMTCFYSYGKKYRKDLKSGLNREREINSKLKKVYLLFKM